MTCHHSAGDPNCSSHSSNVYARQREYEQEQRSLKDANDRIKDLLARTPNPEIFEIIRFEQIQNHLVIEVQYSSCTKCSFDSKKLMVFENTKIADLVFWKIIDPHFSDKTPTSKKAAPSPSARFPATKIGWQDALSYAKWKAEQPTTTRVI